PYETTTLVTVRGAPGEVVRLRVGSVSEPALPPMAAFYMNALVQGVAPDETGLHDARAEHVFAVSDHPIGVGTSLAFNGSTSRLEVAGADALNAQAPGFRVDIKPLAGGGVVFDHEDGAHVLRLEADGRL